MDRFDCTPLRGWEYCYTVERLLSGHQWDGIFCPLNRGVLSSGKCNKISPLAKNFLLFYVHPHCISYILTHVSLY